MVRKRYPPTDPREWLNRAASNLALAKCLSVSEKNLGYDIISLDLNSGELRLIEVKGIGAAEGSVMLTPSEKDLETAILSVIAEPFDSVECL